MSIFQISVPPFTVLTISIILLHCIHLNRAFFTTHFTLIEETPVGTSLGSLATKLPIQFRHELHQIRFRLINNEHAAYFEISPTSGLVKVKQRIDRESLCPESPTNPVPQGHLVNGQCQLSFSVNILRFTQTGVDIAEVVRVIVDVQDVDDNLCEFVPSNHQTIHVTENNPIGQESRIALYRLIDPDTGIRNGISYSSIRLDTKDKMFKLEISNTTSKMAPYALYLILNKPLDYELTQSYNMTLWAGGHRNDSTELCSLNITLNVLDSNDNPPKFLEKSAHIDVMENASLVEPIYTAQASDLDKSSTHSKLIFELSSLNNPLVKSTFHVNPTNGSVFLRQPLRHSQTPAYQLSLIIRNPTPQEHLRSDWLVPPLDTVENPFSNHLYDTMTLFVHVSDINDHSPLISVYTPNGSEFLSLQEEISSPNPIDFALISVTDEDSGRNGQVTCQLRSDSIGQFKLTLIGYEGGQDKPNPGQQQGSQDDGNDDESNIVLYKLSATQPLDREQSEIIPILIRCQDHGLQPLETNYTALLNLIDINDNSPQFETSHIYVQVTEDSDPSRQANRYFIAQLNATDPDTGNNAKLSYHVIQDDATSKLIKLDPKTGVLRSWGKLDREQNASFNVVVMVTDQGQPPKSSSTTVHLSILDYNDEFPKFEHHFYEFKIVENAILGEFVGLVRVKDLDLGLNGVLNFRLEPPTKELIKSRDQDLIPFKIASKFVKDLGQYEVRLFAHGEIDREAWIRDRLPATDADALTHNRNPNRTNPYFEFLIRAEDSGTPKRVSTVTVFVDILDLNDNVPRFIKPEPTETGYRVSYLTEVGDELIQVKAIDHDADENGTVRYSIIDAFPAETCTALEEGLSQTRDQQRPQCELLNYVSVDSVTGLITLHESMRSAMIGLQCRLIIEAKDSGPTSSQSHLSICLLVTDDPYPVGNHSADNQWTTSFQKYHKRHGSTFYLYVFTLIISLGLIVSVMFLCASCWIWRKSKLKSTTKSGFGLGRAADLVQGTTANSNMTTGTADSVTYQNLYTPIPNFVVSESSNELPVIPSTPHPSWTNFSYTDPLNPPQHQFHTLPSNHNTAINNNINKCGFAYTNDPMAFQTELNDYHVNLHSQSHSAMFADHISPLIPQPNTAYSTSKDRRSVRSMQPY